jgi:hypothetical protein
LDYQRRPRTPPDSTGCGARFRRHWGAITFPLGHDYGKWGTIPLQPEKCPTSQRNPAPLQTESVPHFDRNPQNGGKLVIETAYRLVDERFAELHVDVVPGQYAALTMSDTGTYLAK